MDQPHEIGVVRLDALEIIESPDGGVLGENGVGTEIAGPVQFHSPMGQDDGEDQGLHGSRQREGQAIMGDRPPEQAGGIFKSLAVQPQLLFQRRVQGGVSASLAATGDDPLAAGQQHGPVLMVVQSEVLHGVGGHSEGVSVIAIPVAEAGQHAPGVGFAVHAGVGKPASGGQEVREDGGRHIGQAAQVGVWIKVPRREQLDWAQASSQRTEEQKHFFKLDVGREGEPNLGQGEDEGRMDALQHLGLQFLPEAVVITHMAGVNPETGGLGG